MVVFVEGEKKKKEAKPRACTRQDHVSSNRDVTENCQLHIAIYVLVNRGEMHGTKKKRGTTVDETKELEETKEKKNNDNKKKKKKRKEID